MREKTGPFQAESDSLPPSSSQLLAGQTLSPHQKYPGWNHNPPCNNSIQDRGLFQECLTWIFRFADNGSRVYWRKPSDDFTVPGHSSNAQRDATSSLASQTPTLQSSLLRSRPPT